MDRGEGDAARGVWDMIGDDETEGSSDPTAEGSVSEYGGMTGDEGVSGYGISL